MPEIQIVTSEGHWHPHCLSHWSDSFGSHHPSQPLLTRHHPGPTVTWAMVLLIAYWSGIQLCSYIISQKYVQGTWGNGATGWVCVFIYVCFGKSALHCFSPGCAWLDSLSPQDTTALPQPVNSCAAVHEHISAGQLIVDIDKLASAVSTFTCYVWENQFIVLVQLKLDF